MKTVLAICLCICMGLMSAGCTIADSDPSTTPTAPTISLEEISEDTQAPDGTVIFTRAYPRIKIICDSQTIAQNMEADLNARIDRALADAAELEEFAREDYSGQADWTAYHSNIRCVSMRLDSKVLSVYFEHSVFSGGNHPTLTTQSVTYDLTDGKPLKLVDILVEGYSVTRLSIPVNAALAASYDGLFDDYEAIVAENFSDATKVENWYFSSEGLCFHFAPYEVGPYATGTVVATIPYADLEGIVQDAYLPGE